MLDIRSLVTDRRVLDTMEILGAAHLGKVSVTIEEVESAYDSGNTEIIEMVDYILFDERD